MANPRQRSKGRSHKSTKPSNLQKRRMNQKLRRVAPLLGPEALQKAWDKKKTVFQNYRALGLLPSLPVAKGNALSRNHRVPLPVLPTEDDEEAPKVGFGRIIRDAEGNVIDIIIDDEPEEEDESEAKDGKAAWKPLNAEEEVRAPVKARTDVVKQLENLAAQSAPVIRHTSNAEREWLTKLVRKHDDDYSAMARDAKINVWQKTPGELKRMVKKAGGAEKLLSAMDQD